MSGPEAIPIGGDLPDRLRIWLVQSLDRLFAGVFADLLSGKNKLSFARFTLLMASGAMIIFPLWMFVHYLSRGVLFLSPPLFLTFAAGFVAWGLARREHWQGWDRTRGWGQ